MGVALLIDRTGCPPLMMNWSQKVWKKIQYVNWHPHLSPIPKLHVKLLHYESHSCFKILSFIMHMVSDSADYHLLYYIKACHQNWKEWNFCWFYWVPPLPQLADFFKTNISSKPKFLLGIFGPELIFTYWKVSRSFLDPSTSKAAKIAHWGEL